MFSVVIAVRADSDEKGTHHNLRLQLLNPDLKPIIEPISLQFDIPTETATVHAEVNLVLTLGDIVFPSFGDYQFQIEIDGQPMQKHIDVLVQPLIQSTPE